MKKQETQQSQTQGMYFVTFTRKLSQEQTKLILAELRKRFTGQPVFVPRPPGKTKRVILEINGELVIISFPAHKETETKENPKQQSTEGFKHKESEETKENPKQQSTEGFKLSELIKNKI